MVSTKKKLKKLLFARDDGGYGGVVLVYLHLKAIKTK